LVFAVEQGPQALHFIVERFQGGVCREEALQEEFTALGEVVWVHAQGGE
jgi:hypothetical protein